jgi:HAD superfamily hydrolase (TIGR01459 family)
MNVKLLDFQEVQDSYKAFLLDAYGVFWGGNALGVLPGSKEAMERMVASGKIVGILSNSTQRAEAERHKLERFEIKEGKHYHFLITSGEAAKQLFLAESLPFATPRNTFLAFSASHPRFASLQVLFEGSRYKEVDSLEEADFVYLTVPHIEGEDQEDVEVFRNRIQEIQKLGLPLVCGNPDLLTHEGCPPRLVVRQGSIAKLYEEMGGEVFYIGKPYLYVYELALKQFASEYGINNPEEILMVGDTPETDIRGAVLAKMPAALVMETGIMAHRVAQKGFEKALRELSLSDRPTYFIKRFALS